LADGVSARRAGGTWVIGAQAVKSLSVNGQQVVGAQQAAIAAPAGGTVIDTQARSAVASIISALRQHGLVAT
jgi:hypothetical protein